jgi:hypothetical protein
MVKPSPNKDLGIKQSCGVVDLDSSQLYGLSTYDSTRILFKLTIQGRLANAGLQSKELLVLFYVRLSGRCERFHRSLPNRPLKLLSPYQIPKAVIEIEISKLLFQWHILLIIKPLQAECGVVSWDDVTHRRSIDFFPQPEGGANADRNRSQ